MVSDQVPFEVSRDGDIARLSAFIYFFAESLHVPSSQAIPRMDKSPALRLPPCRLQQRGLSAPLNYSFANSPRPVVIGIGDGTLGIVVGVRIR